MPSGTIIHSSNKATEGLTRNQPGFARRILRAGGAISMGALAVVVELFMALNRFLRAYEDPLWERACSR
ncbi:hypothetical protein D3C76_1871550 [compost metagenome]